MRRHIKRLHGHMRRLGHFTMKPLEDATASIRKMAKDNPEVAAAAVGAGVAGAAAGMGVGTAMLLGGAAGVAAEKLTK